MAFAIEFRDVVVRAPAGGLILDTLNLSIARGQSVALVGRSGAGKTTALRLINGLVMPSSGEVLVDGQPLATIDLVGLRRRTGYIIQGVGLFPHRTIYQNVATVPRLLGWDESQIRAAAPALLDGLAIPFDRYAGRYPRTLSGGEQQRVGIARALIAEPEILLCDEPFGALDPIVRREQQDAFISLRAARAATIVFVTHDLREALRVSERIVLLDRGRIVLDRSRDRFLESSEPLARQFIESATLH
jgi:osmoprotectant transport system ATP-binding protein